jgi:hypothetical protein
LLLQEQAVALSQPLCTRIVFSVYQMQYSCKKSSRQAAGCGWVPMFIVIAATFLLLQDSYALVDAVLAWLQEHLAHHKILTQVTEQVLEEQLQPTGPQAHHLPQV